LIDPADFAASTFAWANFLTPIAIDRVTRAIFRAVDFAARHQSSTGIRATGSLKSRR